jgi:hypothetical protein
MVTDTWQLVDMVGDRLEAQSGPLGLKFVGKYSEKLIPKYPAVIVVPGPRAKNLHGTHTFQVALELHLYVYHANLNATKRERSKEDLQLVARLEEELESDFRWEDETGGARVIHGFVASEEPGLLQPSVNKSSVVICTRLTWRAISQRRF